MKKKFICFAILILTAYILLYPADAVNASRNGLMLWYEKVLPTLLPFAIISNVLIHSGYMDALTKHLTKYFRFFMPVSGEGVFILCSGFLFGFPMGSKNCAELLKANKIHPKEAEILFYGFYRKLYFVAAVTAHRNVRNQYFHPVCPCTDTRYVIIAQKKRGKQAEKNGIPISNNF